MAIRNSTPVPFLPAGVSDAVDQAFPGSCQALQNLIFDRVNRGAVIPRPGAVLENTFTGFVAPSIVSVAFSVGKLIYGMVASARSPGFDEPFCYDTSTNLFIPVSGVTGNNVPNSPLTTGDWIPPTIDVVGVNVIVTHQGFSGSNYFGWFNVTNPAAPVWNAGNTSTNPLPSKPLWVAQFFGRAYFGVANSVLFTDTLTLSISNSNFASTLTIDGTSNTTAACGLPLSNTTGGVLQSLVIFKENSVWQITGDIALTGNPLSLNKLVSNIGCVMPRTIQSTPIGVIFISTDGPRVIGTNSLVTYLKDPNLPTPDIVSMFSKATYPSRACAAYNNGIYRICFDGAFNIWDSAYTSGDYWFDLIFGRWNGPHTFPYHCVVSVGDKFYLFSNNHPGSLYSNQVVPNNSIYTDNGMAYGCTLVSSAISGAPMTMSSVTESTIELCGAGIGASYFISIYDDQNNPLSPATISLSKVEPIYGQNKFGQFVWKSSVITSHTYTIPWPNPIVTKKIILVVNVVALKNVSIKESMFRVSSLGYTNA